jgi:hypothetical protein
LKGILKKMKKVIKKLDLGSVTKTKHAWDGRQPRSNMEVNAVSSP